MFSRPLKALWGSMKLLLLAGLLGASSMLVSFLVVNHLARDVVAAKAVDPALIWKANTLRLFSNELASLCNAYARLLSADPATATVQVTPWVENVFRPEVQFLQQRMDETFREDSTLSVQLEAAAARCATMARHPADAAVRAGAFRETATTVATVEAWIAGEGIDARLSAHAVPVHFP